MALRVEETGDTDAFLVSGRGELHLTILIENMRREGYELAVSRPRVVLREIAGVTCEPYEALSVDVEEAHQGAVMEALGMRRGDLTNMESDSQGRTRLEYRMPARGLIGFQGEFMNLTRGTGLMSHVFDAYAPVKGDIPGTTQRRADLAGRRSTRSPTRCGSCRSAAACSCRPAKSCTRAWSSASIAATTISSSTRSRASSSPTCALGQGRSRSALTPPIELTLEYAVEFIADDELVEITPKSIRIRKRYLKEHERKRASREAA